MSHNFDKKSEEPKEWKDIVYHGVVRPHPISTKDDLWIWINDHAELLDRLRQQYLDQFKPQVCKRGRQ